MESSNENNNNNSPSNNQSSFFNHKPPSLLEKCRDKYKYYEMDSLPGEFWISYDQIKGAILEDLHAGEYDDHIQVCLNIAKSSSDKKALRLIAYTLFSGPKSLPNNFYDAVLLHLFANEKTSVDVIVKLIIDRFEDWKSRDYQQICAAIKEQNDNVDLSREAEKNVNTDTNASDFIYFGGLFAWQDFLHGNFHGYSYRDNPGVGIKLIIDNGSDYRTFQLNSFGRCCLDFDLPVTVYGEVPSYCLTPACIIESNNCALLSFENVSKLIIKNMYENKGVNRGLAFGLSIDSGLLLTHYPATDSLNLEILKIINEFYTGNHNTQDAAAVDNALNASAHTITHS